MPFIIAILGILGAVYFFVIRARNTAHMAGELVDVANDIRLAARRFGFRRRLNEHPVDSIDDANIAISALATAFLELDDLPTQDQRDRLNGQLRDVLALDAGAVEEMTVLGRWLVGECGGADPAVARLSRKLFKLQGADALQPTLSIINGTLQGQDTGLSTRQKEALDDIKRAFRLS